MLVGFGLTLSIEVLQTWVVAGRDASLGDLAANTLGVAVGVALASYRRSLLAPDRHAARVLLTVGLAAAIGLGAFGAWGLKPAPPDEAYYAQWQPQLGQFGVFPGEVVDARLDGERFPRWRVESGRELAEAMRQREVHFAATVIPGAPTDRLSPIVSVFDEERREVLILAQEGRDLVFRHRTGLRDLRFRSPGTRLANVFPAAAGEADTLHVSATLDGHQIELAAGGPGVAARRVAALTPDLWWVAPLPFDLNLGALAGLLSALWVAAVALPIGYWSAFAGRTAAALLIAGGVIAALGLVAAIGAPPPSWWSAAGALAGGAVGWTLGRRRRRRTVRVLLPAR